MLPGALFVLVTVGFVGPCLVDAARTPRHHVGGLSKAAWLAVIIGFWAFGAAAWLLAGRPRRRWPARRLPGPAGPAGGLSPREALRHHPAWRSAEASHGCPDTAADAPGSRAPGRPAGPDDDPEFLTALARRIRGRQEDR